MTGTPNTAAELQAVYQTWDRIDVAFATTRRQKTVHVEPDDMDFLLIWSKKGIQAVTQNLDVPHNSVRPGVRYTLEVYLYSPSLDMDACVRIIARVPLPVIDKDVDPAKALGAFGRAIPETATDWRFMTDAEMDDYCDNPGADDD